MGAFQAGPQGASLTAARRWLAGWLHKLVKRNAAFKAAVKSTTCEEILFVTF